MLNQEEKAEIMAKTTKVSQVIDERGRDISYEKGYKTT